MKINFSIDKHIETAGKIRDIHSDLNEMLRDVSSTYGIASREIAMIERIKLQLGNFRSVMDSNIIKENFSKPLKEVNCYYSGQE
jgi:hypothetical protein